MKNVFPKQQSEIKSGVAYKNVDTIYS